MKEIALYIHIPFCSTKCKYCAFSVLTDQHQKDEYLSALEQELTIRLSHDTSIKTIYFGGGTPSTLQIHEVESILHTIDTQSDTANLQEVSFEVNPEHVTAEYIQALLHLGVTRVSMGVQSLNEEALRIAGRSHNAQQALLAMSILHDSNISWNADLILGLPGQDPAETLDHLETIYTYRPSHISLYFLSIEAGTEFSLHKKTFFPKEKNVIESYSKLIHSFDNKGYQQYEISNWAQPNHESKHNLMYWKGAEYIGVGLGASSYVNNTVFNNYKNMNLYLKQDDKTEPSSVQKLDSVDAWYLRAMTGLRLAEGIPLEHIQNNLTPAQRESIMTSILQLREQGLVCLDEHLTLTPKGRLYADFVTEKMREAL